MKTIKQVAEELEISKQKLYRYIKSHHITDAHQTASVIYIDDVLESKLKQHFLSETVSDDVHHDAHQTASNDAVIEALLMQLQKKDEQIETLQKLLDQEQQLHAMVQNELKVLEEKTLTAEAERTEIVSKKKWQFWK